MSNIDYKNPQWYVELFKKYDIDPHPGHASVNAFGTCALGIACVELGIDTKECSITWIDNLATKTGASTHFLEGVICGFDGMRQKDIEFRTEARAHSAMAMHDYLEGVKVGQEVRRLA